MAKLKLRSRYIRILQEAIAKVEAHFILNPKLVLSDWDGHSLTGELMSTIFKISKDGVYIFDSIGRKRTVKFEDLSPDEIIDLSDLLGY